MPARMPVPMTVLGKTNRKKREEIVDRVPRDRGRWLLCRARSLYVHCNTWQYSSEAGAWAFVLHVLRGGTMDNYSNSSWQLEHAEKGLQALAAKSRGKMIFPSWPSYLKSDFPPWHETSTRGKSTIWDIAVLRGVPPFDHINSLAPIYRRINKRSASLSIDEV
ncbi:hypothetical protein VTK73DRAFT_7893 [Phialemonium thermophilum]|uniref:Uncharacterized protein n=1 Tax=Phialemonium thermophilum TaxID=223376 RepID=A0ABR3WBW1_9PEZI